MADLAHLDPTGRFTGLADVYARSRPGYPAEALDYVMAHCGLRPGALLVDVGCGTGISARLFAARGLHVVGIEPNADMRGQAEAAAAPPGAAELTYRAGHAEATGLPDETADAVLAAQAFHWFAHEPALREFQRILKPGGWTVLMWNERDKSDPFTAAYGAVVGSTPEAAAVEGPRTSGGDILLASPLFLDGCRATFPYEQELALDGLLRRAQSASYAPREPGLVEQFRADLRAVFERFQRDGKVQLRYTTSVFAARRRETQVAGTGNL